MSVQAVFKSVITVVETIEGEFVDPSDATVTVNGMNEEETFTGATSVPVTKQTAFEQALSSGTAIIDLTALTGLTEEETIDGTGLKVQLCKLVNPDTNANAITIAEGASNGYAMLGASFSLILLPGQSMTLNLDEAAPNIASGDRTIDLTGTGSQVLNVQLVMG